MTMAGMMGNQCTENVLIADAGGRSGRTKMLFFAGKARRRSGTGGRTMDVECEHCGSDNVDAQDGCHYRCRDCGWRGEHFEFQDGTGMHIIEIWGNDDEREIETVPVLR